MPKFYPAEIVKSFRPKSEEKVFDIIKNNFSDSWVVFHSFDYINRLDNGIAQDGEVDFILYNPKYGILILEVKGGSIRYHDGIWYSGHNVIYPYMQVRKNKYAIAALFCKEGEKYPNISMSHAVCFSDIDVDTSSFPAEAQGITLTARDFNDFEKKCIAIMQEHPVFENSKRAPIGYTEVIEKLAPSFDFAGTLRNDIDSDRKTFIRLSELQYEAFGMLRNFQRLNVRGCAGSGKTIIATKLAENLAQQGKQVLMLCFNKILAKRLKRAVNGIHNIDVRAFFDFCIEVANVSETEIQKFSANQKTWDYALPKLAQKAIEKFGICYDAVIVDEGQDFSPEAWKTIQMLTADNGVFHIFYDDDQNIYQHSLNIPPTPYPEITLSVNYRNTQKIFKELKDFISIDGVKVCSDSPIGSDAEFYTITDEQQRRDFILKKLRQLVREHKIQLSDIVILGGHSLKNTCIRTTELGEFFVNEENSVENVKKVNYKTYMKFKGCEAPVVIIIDVDKDDERWKENSALYTSMSRAQSLLIVVYKR